MQNGGLRVLNNRKYLEILNGKLNVIGKNIQEKREQQNLSRQYVSDRLMNVGIDISAQALYEIENGSRTIIDYEIAAIAKILNTTSDALMVSIYEYLENL